MTTRDKVLIAYLLDRSGSMEVIKHDVIGGFNQLIADQRKADAHAEFVLTLFDTQGIDTERFDDIGDVPDLTTETYVPRSGTPLLDAVGKTIHAIDDMDWHGDRILFVIHTDGQENSSIEYDLDAIRALIKEHEDVQNWDFLFLGVDMDAYAQANLMGINQGSTVSTVGHMSGSTYAVTSQAVTDYTTTGADPRKKLKKEEKRQKAKSST